MAGYVCVVAGGNGGVGKTTTAVNLGAALESRGHDTVVVDADLGMPNVEGMLGIDHDRALHDILADESTVSETLTGGPGGMTVIPGEPRLKAYADADPQKLRKVIRTLRQAFDVVIVDTAAGLRDENTVLFELADGVVLTTTPDHVSLTDTGKTGQLAELVDSEILGTLIVRATTETKIADIDAEFGFPVLGGIPEDGSAAGDEPLVLGYPDSPAAVAFRDLAAQFECVLEAGASGADQELVPREWFE